jgi:hypothetical protein
VQEMKPTLLQKNKGFSEIEISPPLEKQIEQILP